MSQKDIDKILDEKILDYLNTSDSKEESKEMPVDENGAMSFGQSVTAQLRKMNTRQNALAKAKRSVTDRRSPALIGSRYSDFVVSIGPMRRRRLSNRSGVILK